MVFRHSVIKALVCLFFSHLVWHQNVLANSETKHLANNDFRAIFIAVEKDNARLLSSVSYLANRLPNGVNSGLWLGQTPVVKLASPRTVDANWRMEAIARSAQIQVDQLSLESAPHIMNQLAGIVKSYQPGKNNHLLIWIDEAWDYKEEYYNAIAGLIEALGHQDIVLHIITKKALNHNNPLVRYSLNTGGVVENLSFNNDVTTIFNDIVDVAIPQQSLAVVNNEFTLESNAKSLRLVVDGDHENIILQTPEGDFHNAKQYGKNFHWVSNSSYNIIEVDKPSAGKWLIAGAEKANKTLYLNALPRLTVIPAYASVLVNDKPKMGFFLGDSKGNFKKKALKDIDIKLKVTKRGGEPRVLSVSGNYEPNGLGAYNIPVEWLDSEGVFDIELNLNGKQLHRQYKQSIQTFARLNAVIESNDASPPEHLLTIYSRDLGIDATVTPLIARVELPEGDSKLLRLTSTDAQTWQLKLPISNISGQYTVAYESFGNTGFQYVSKPLKIAHSIKATAVINAAEKTSVSSDVASSNQKSEEVETSKKETSYLLWAAVAAAVLIIILLSVTIFLLLKRNKKPQDVVKNTESEVASAPEPAAEKPAKEKGKTEVAAEKSSEKTTEQVAKTAAATAAVAVDAEEPAAEPGNSEDLDWLLSDDDDGEDVGFEALAQITEDSDKLKEDTADDELEFFDDPAPSAEPEVNSGDDELEFFDDPTPSAEPEVSGGDDELEFFDDPTPSAEPEVSGGDDELEFFDDPAPSAEPEVSGGDDELEFFDDPAPSAESETSSDDELEFFDEPAAIDESEFDLSNEEESDSSGTEEGKEDKKDDDMDDMMFL